jgi:chemotaxis protein methyltransferase CheR
MESSLSEALLAQFSDCLAARVGLYFPRDRWPELTRGIDLAAADLGFSDAATCMRHLLSADLTRAQIEVLASHLTVGETYFFREPRSFEVLANRVLPELIQSRQAESRSIRIWSAACCTGEEAYSIAILLDQLIPDLANWNVTILATDINPHFLQRAEEGLYKEWSFRGVGRDIQDRYFTREAGGLRIHPRIRSMVTLSYHNLVEDRFPSIDSNTNAMDVVLCRNVLMYFSPDRARAVVGYLHRALRDGGWLIPSAVDGAPPLFAPFVLADVEGASFYRKREAPPPMVSARHIEPIISQRAPAARSAPSDRSGENGSDAYRAASAFHDQGRYAEASETLIGHLTDEREDVPAMLLLARTYANQGRLAEALQWCLKVIAADRLSAGHYYLLAMIQQEMGELADAAASLHRALFLDSQFVLAHFASANLARIEGKRPEARKHYQNTLRLLEGRPPDDVLPESEGLTVERLREIARHAAGMIDGGSP